MRLNNERGAALITALLVMASFSLLTAAIVFTVQTDVQISANYKYGEQAYYVANAGVQKSLYWFNTAYVPHTPVSDYDVTKVPLQYNNNDVILSGKSGVTSNYPDSGTSTSFYSNLGDQTLQADGNNTGAYQVNATVLRSKAVKLLDIVTFTVYSGSLERWRLDSTGFWGSSANPLGRSEVSAVIEKQAIPFWSKALWVKTEASFTGGSLVDSYDPALGPYGGANVGTNGDIASNGNMIMSGSGTTIKGDLLYGPEGAFTIKSSATVTGEVSRLVETKDFPPIPAFTVGTTDVKINDGLSTHTLGPGNYGTISLDKSGTNLTLTGGTYYMDQLKMTGNTSLTVAPGAKVTLYIKSDFSVQGAIVNSDQDPASLTINYSGTANATLNGGTGFYGTVYAPNAQLTLAGNANYYGSFMTDVLKVSGGANIHYDSELLKEYLIPKPFRIITWTQKNS